MDVLVAINADADTCRAIAAGRAYRTRHTELLAQQQRLNKALARTPAQRQDKVRQACGKQVDRTQRSADQAADRYSARLRLLPKNVQQRVRTAVGPERPERTPMAALSPAMRTALTSAGRPTAQGPAVLSCRRPTAQALVRRSLAYLDDELGPVLTQAGLSEAARLIDQGRELQRCDAVIYHGSLEREHGNEFAVVGQDSAGRFAIVDTYNGSVVLQNVRRSSLRYIGRTFDPETGGVA